MSAEQLPEAPVSWNVRYISRQGYDCQLTLRGNEACEVLRLANELMGKMAQVGVSPGHGRKPLLQQTPAAPADPTRCALHGCAMTRYERQGKTWYAHRSDNGGWCRGQ